MEQRAIAQQRIQVKHYVTQEVAKVAFSHLDDQNLFAIVNGVDQVGDKRVLFRNGRNYGGREQFDQVISEGLEFRVTSLDDDGVLLLVKA